MASGSLGASPARRRRAPGLVNTGLALLVLALVLSIALRAQNNNPPAIAEFAPQPQKPITQAPQEQTAVLGHGGGGAALAAPAPSPSPTAGIPPGAILRQCIGDPPRQIEDPQSPPCVPFWHGDNGGSTSMGVTGSDVTIVVPDWDANKYGALMKFFNKRFEFYGRKLNFVPIDNKDNSSPQAERADADQAVAHWRPFASTNWDQSPGYYYYVELAQKHVVSSAYFPEFTETQMAQYDPYLWQYPMADDREFANLGSWACARLVGQDAVHAGPALQGKPRKFGVVLDEVGGVRIDSTPLKQQLATCGASVASEFEIQDWSSAQNSTNAVLQFANAGVTTVFCLCYVWGEQQLGAAAHSQGYQPEWLVSSYFIDDTNTWMRDFGFPADQRAHVFGLSFVPRQNPEAEMASDWAMRDGDPTWNDRNNGTFVQLTYIEYRSLLLLAAGIQMAGPHLTPQAFGDALHRTVFPNPYNPIMAGHVGFGGGEHSMTVDAAEIWWSDEAAGPYNDDQGTFCYVQGGARHTSQNWPHGGDPFFGLQCNTSPPPPQPGEGS